jgi:cation transport ATPase
MRMKLDRARLMSRTFDPIWVFGLALLVAYGIVEWRLRATITDEDDVVVHLATFALFTVTFGITRWSFLADQSVSAYVLNLATTLYVGVMVLVALKLVGVFGHSLAFCAYVACMLVFIFRNRKRFRRQKAR